MSGHRTALLWLRRDLRLTDNPALRHALANADQVIPVFIHAPDEEAPWGPGAASRWWLHHSLAALTEDLRKRASRVVLRLGPTLPALRTLIAETKATLVTWNRLYEPAILARDARIETELSGDDIEVASHNASLLFEPWTLRTKQQQPYRVFTAFWRVAETQLDLVPAPTPAPRRISSPRRWPSSLALGELQLLPRIRWDKGLAAQWQPGEAGALRRLRRFSSAAEGYRAARDRPDDAATSRLSPHLHFGEIGPRQMLAGLRSSAAAEQAVAAYRRQLGWREFAHQLLYNFPQTNHNSLDERFERLKWSQDKKRLRAWQGGLTGYPMVDAGLRELWSTGWMHNRVRMIVASLLTKNLQTHWIEGARWFWDTLVDADLANNTLGWQWTAGCGADAAPYYRIFNPVLQAEKFDPRRRYIRRWVPELARLPDKWIAQPWVAPATVLAAAGVVLGKTYPSPVVELRRSRAAALAAYESIRQP
jgi:deoxyribodipyrimidine photo-lyase